MRPSRNNESSGSMETHATLVVLYLKNTATLLSRPTGDSVGLVREGQRESKVGCLILHMGSGKVGPVVSVN